MMRTTFEAVWTLARWSVTNGLAFALITHASPVAAAENRCAELGDACVCSEPLNAQITIPPGEFVNPPDSTDYECSSDQMASPVYANGGGEMVAGFGMPAGNAVDWVLRIDSDGVATLRGAPLTFTEGTVCSRIYQRFSSDFPDVGVDERAKLMQFSLETETGTPLMHQTQWHFGQPRVKVETTGFGITEDLSWSGPTVTLADCRASWCRMEQCIDKYASGRVVGRTRIVALDSGHTMVFTSSDGFEAGSVTLATAWIGNLYRQNATIGNRYVSHGIQAFWPQANEAWIGAASEIETGEPPEPTLTSGGGGDAGSGGAANVDGGGNHVDGGFSCHVAGGRDKAPAMLYWLAAAAAAAMRRRRL